MIVVPVKEQVVLRTRTKKRVKQVAWNDEIGNLRLEPDASDLQGVILTGVNPGVNQVKLIDEDGKVEVYEVIIQARSSAPVVKSSAIPELSKGSYVLYGATIHQLGKPTFAGSIVVSVDKKEIAQDYSAQGQVGCTPGCLCYRCNRIAHLPWNDRCRDRSGPC